MTESRNVTAIKDWCAANRPDIADSMERIIENGDNAHILLMAVAFEAGRMFQAERAAQPTLYVPMEEFY